jgi:hypothetical protein
MFGKNLESGHDAHHCWFLICRCSKRLACTEFSELASRYGEPDVERFTARPGIAVTVEYGSDRLVCQALIEPPNSIITLGRPPHSCTPKQ